MSSKRALLVGHHSLALQTALARVSAVSDKVILAEAPASHNLKRLDLISPMIEPRYIDPNKRTGKGRNKGGRSRW